MEQNVQFQNLQELTQQKFGGSCDQNLLELTQQKFGGFPKTNELTMHPLASGTMI